MANTPSNVASAAAIEGIGAARSDTRPLGQAPSATVQKNNGGLLRYGASRTRAGSRGPWRSVSSASKTTRASSWFQRGRVPMGIAYMIEAALSKATSRAR